MEQQPTAKAEAASDAVFEPPTLDAVFEQASKLPPEPPDPGPVIPALPEPPEEIRPVRQSADSPLRDYVREIQQEFEEQEEEGKL